MKNQVEIHELKPAGTETYKVYKIRCKQTGFFSTGGAYPTFSEKGKEWYSRAALSSHLGLRSHHYGHGYAYDKAEQGELEIVTYEYEVKKSEVETENVEEYYQGLMKRREKRTAESKRAEARRQLDLAQRDLEYAAARLKELQGRNG